MLNRKSDLLGSIMNIPIDRDTLDSLLFPLQVGFGQGNEEAEALKEAFQLGHREARHKAVEILLAQEESLEPSSAESNVDQIKHYLDNIKYDLLLADPMRSNIRITQALSGLARIRDLL